MLSLREISDRLEIQDLLSRYSFAIDERNWDALDDVFTPDAVIDYSEAGGAKGTLAQIKACDGPIPALSAYGRHHEVGVGR